jgi:NAD(P)-dependent dehydrogenase (short-subunit alcohol dehydrogenase family)
MRERLADKICIVTGGLSGIGLAIAQRFVQEGARVIAADLSTEASSIGDEALAPLHMDVADPDSVQRGIDAVLAKHGRLDCLVNSAGIGKDVPFLETSLDLFDKIVGVNLRGTFIVGQAAARAMAAGGGGAIVNIASVSGMTGNVGRSAYGASKGGVVILSKVMAVDLASQGIRVNILAPGPVETPLVAQMHSDAIRQRWAERVPLARYASPEEMAGAALFLCSDEASYVTGHVLAVDGGFMGSGLTMAPGV